jgi:hypothetical protein
MGQKGLGCGARSAYGPVPRDAKIWHAEPTKEPQRDRIGGFYGYTGGKFIYRAPPAFFLEYH